MTNKNAVAPPTPSEASREDELIHWRSIAFGGNLDGRSVVFSHDSRYIFCPFSTSIKVYSAETGLRLDVIPAHSDQITTLALHPTRFMQLYSSSFDGTIKVWDTEDRALLQTHDLKSINNFVFNPVRPDVLYFISRKALRGSRMKPSKDAKHTFQLCSYNLETLVTEVLYVFEDYTRNSLVASPRGDMISFISGPMIVLCDFATNEIKRHQIKQQAPSTIAFHPFERYLAIGDITGKITLYWPDKAGKPNSIMSTLHWHAHTCNALCFTTDGAYLLSGGLEAVMVIWQLQTGQKTFVPRLGESITNISISPNQAYYAITLEDNSIRLIDSLSRELRSKIKGVAFGGVPPTGLNVDPVHHRVVLNGKYGSLQFYNMFEDTTSMEIEIAPIPPTSVKTSKTQTVYTAVTRVCFAPNGMWMVTAENKVEATDNEHLVLKFWSLSADQRYKLKTQVNSPHKSDITSISYHPTEDIVVTTSKDCSFKTWTKFAEEKRYPNTRAAEYWTARSSGVYRNLQMTSSDFSKDGSLLAVACEHLLTLWEPKSQTLLTTLNGLGRSEAIRDIAFISNSPFLVARTLHKLVVWNILTCTVWWSFEVDARVLVVDPHSSRFAIYTVDSSEKRVILLFDPARPKPIGTWAGAHPPRAMAFYPSKDGSPSGLIYLNRKREIVYLGPQAEPKLSLNSEANTQSKNAPAISQLSVLPSNKSNKQQVRESLPEITMKEHTQEVAGLFDTPSHVIPPLTMLFSSFIETILSRSGDSKNEQKSATDATQSLSGDAMEVEASIPAADKTKSKTKTANEHKNLEREKQAMAQLIATFPHFFAREYLPAAAATAAIAPTPTPTTIPATPTTTTTTTAATIPEPMTDATTTSSSTTPTKKTRRRSKK